MMTSSETSEEPISFEESGVTFGYFNRNYCFRIEKSDFYKNTLQQHGIKTTEFLLLRDNKLFVVEAKTSTPNPSSKDLHKTCSICDNKTTGWNIYLDALLKKYNDTLSMQVLLNLNRLDNTNVLPSNFIFNWQDIPIYLVLVITSEEEHYRNKDFINHIQILLRQKMKSLLKLWNVELLVLNKEMAIKRKFILQNQG